MLRFGFGFVVGYCALGSMHIGGLFGVLVC